MLAFRKFLNYSYEPFRLHFCGPQDAASFEVVDDFLRGRKISHKRIQQVAEEFVGVYPYLKLIAKKNDLEPLNKQVIEAYWLGNNLLKQVTANDLKELIMNEFVGPGRLDKATGEKLSQNIPLRAAAHHSFHVLYIGSITNTVQLVGKMLDLCRVSWGEAVMINKTNNKSTLLVKYNPLLIKSNEIKLSRDEVKKEIKWNQKILPKIIKGQSVSFHWDLACEILSEDQVKNLEKYTLRNIEAINSINY